MSEQMPSQYDPAAAERRWYPEWVERGYFRADATSDKPAYCIVLPPPNVTGALHIGHALDHTIQDMLIRRARMQGFEALWLPGTDHAGIATQVVVERSLREEEGIDRRELGRDKFVERVWAWKEQYGGRIVEQMKALGNSCDWSRLRFTMDERLSQAVRIAFVRMYGDGLIYRGERLINWCPTDHTGLSDSEVEHAEVEGELVTFRYPLSDGSGHVDVATTRVETMLGDTGVAVHPDDERYKPFVGRSVRHPFTEADLPVVADAAVDREFGTGAVKVTPAHDPNDWEIAERTGLPYINILNPEARLSDAVPEEFRGLDRYEARARVRERLDGLGLIVSEERPYRHAVGHCYRCHNEIEPWLSGKQWFVKVEPLKGPARDAVREGRIRFTPERWAKPYDAWMEGLRDWNISRQLWWGHRIPVWYCPQGHEVVPEKEDPLVDPTTCAECGSTDLDQDPDVLDTWFSSQLWPFSTLGWPDEGDRDLKVFYPTTVLVTGYEILYLWVARMIMAGLQLAGDVPFKQVVIHGLVRDVRGRKMSKSLGNVIDPLDMIERYGADALRYALARMATPDQQNLPLAEESIEAGRNFANKIWNAARLVLSVGGRPELPSKDRLGQAEKWLLGRHQACVREVSNALDRDQFADAAVALHRFLWSEYCDWGLEMEKDRLYEGPAEQRETAANTLAWILERTLRLLHPIMPFVTEEVWQRFSEGTSIVVAAWPEDHPELVDPQAERDFGAVMELVSGIREFRGLFNIAPRQRLKVGAADDLTPTLAPLLDDAQRLANADIELEKQAMMQLSDAVTWRIASGRWFTVYGSIDRETARSRLEKKRSDLARQHERSSRKLKNKGFVEKAAPDVRQRERERLEGLADEIAFIDGHLEEL